MVRATRGNLSGPMTMSATTAITISSENPTSNTLVERLAQAGTGPASGCSRRPSGLGLVLDFAFDGATGELLPAFVALVARLLHAVLEPAHRAAEIGADVAQLLRAEDQKNDHQHYQPMPNAPGTHGVPFNCVSASGPR